MKARVFILLMCLWLPFSVTLAAADDDQVTGDATQVSEESADDAEKAEPAPGKESKVDAKAVADDDTETDDYEEDLLQSPRRSISKSKLCRTIYLMYTRAEDVHATLKEVFEADINAGGLSITHNAGTNSIIMRLTDAENKVADDVSDVINSLDFRTGQVLIDVLVVELSISDDELFSAEWKELVVNPARTANSLLNVGVDHGLINSDDPTAITKGFKAFITSNNKMKMFLNALNTKGKVHVVSSPHIVTANHREATFKIGEKLPLIDSVRPSDAGPITTFNIADVGLELIVTPHINRGGEIDMEVHQTINAVLQDTYDSKQGTARMTTREAKTNLTVSDNETIILGGFIEDKKDRAEHRIPILSNIPWLGKLFTSVKKTSRKTELMVFITPKILNTKEDAEVVTKTMVSRTREKDKINSLLEMRKRVESLLKPEQEIIIDRRSHGWHYGIDTKEIDDLVWLIPQKIEIASLTLPLRGSAPFGFGASKRLVPAPVRTYLKASEGAIFMKEFTIEDPEKYRRVGLRMACDNAASVYLNGVLVDEDPMMKMKDGHDFQYWNRERDDIPAGLLHKGANHLVVFLGSEKDAADSYFDMMLIGDTRK